MPQDVSVAWDESPVWRALTLRFASTVELARTIAGDPPGHDLAIAFPHGLQIVIPPGFWQGVREVMNQHARLIDLELRRDGGVRPGDKRSPVGVGLG